MTNLNTHLIRTVPTLAVRTDPAACRAHWVAWRNDNGVPTATAPELLTRPDHNVKLGKSAVPTYGLSLAPSKVSGSWNTCPWATAKCIRGCLNTAGKGTLDKVQRGRILKTRYLAEHPAEFLCILADEIAKAAARHPEGIRMRLNVLSDLDWPRIDPTLFAISGVRFYDYTKDRDRLSRPMPDNYNLTYSASERTSDADIAAMVAGGQNVAVVLTSKPGPTFRGLPMVNGDESDDRTLDPRGVVVGLKAKGKMRDHDAFAGFVKVADS
jgi:hypothetical protein